MKLYHLNTALWGVGECTSELSNCAHGSADNHYTSPQAAKRALVASTATGSPLELDLQVFMAHCEAGVFEPNPDLSTNYDKCKPGTIILRSVSGRKEWIVKLANGDWHAIYTDENGLVKPSGIPYSTLAFTAGSIAVTSGVELADVFVRPYGLSDEKLASVSLVTAEAIYSADAAGASNYPTHWTKLREETRVQYITFASFFVDEIFRSHEFGGTDYSFPHETIYAKWDALFPSSRGYSYNDAPQTLKKLFFEAYTEGLRAIVDWSEA